MLAINKAAAGKIPEKELKAAERTMLMALRREPAVTRIARPTKPGRARSLGYKAKTGFVVARARVLKGLRKTPKKGRRSPKASGRYFSTGLSLQAIAEQRVSKRFPNLEVLNSYLIAEDGKNKWFEVLMADPCSGGVTSDKDRSWVASGKHRGRAMRGRTSAGRRARGLHNKGKGTEKIRPSLRSQGHKGK